MEQVVTEFRTAITCIIKMIIEDIFLVLCIYSSYNQAIFYVNKIRERLFSAHNAGQIFLRATLLFVYGVGDFRL